jgi:hypothetical protein
MGAPTLRPLHRACGSLSSQIRRAPRGISGPALERIENSSTQLITRSDVTAAVRQI